MPKEIELKFILNTDVKIEGELLQSYSIIQGYLAEGENLIVRSRLRSILGMEGDTDDEGFITIKSKCKGFARDEYEYKIPSDEAWDMIKSADSSLSKVRNVYEIDGHKFEIDAFEGKLKGLFLAELEFKTIEEANAFDPSLYPFLGKNVSEDRDFSNHSLSLLERYEN